MVIFSKVMCNLDYLQSKDIDLYVDVAGIGVEKAYKLNLIYSEYLHKIDICCLDMDKISAKKDSGIYKHNKGHDDFIYQLPVLLAVELKFIKGERTGNFFGAIKDEEKIKTACKKVGIENYLCLCFIQSQTIANLHIKNMPSEFKIEPVDNIEKPNISYVITPEKTYTLTKI
jgi:hypothetical protein